VDRRLRLPPSERTLKPIKKVSETDVLFMHADDEATIRYQYSASELRESLLFHILYFGRVLVPLPFILDNPEFSSFFRFGGKISEHSDIYRLVKSGDIVPVIYKDWGSINEYAKDAIDRNILIHCSKEEFIQRAELLNEFAYAIPNRADSIEAV